jgi:site-specific DNA-cytosine methylase
MTINVLSLFDDISCGQLALNKAKIAYKTYYASEINESAIKVTQKNFPNTIHLGNVTNVKSNDLPQIDLLMGGSPCQGFSFAGKKLNFNDKRSALFFEFVRLLKECTPKYFLLENVIMKKEHQDIISRELGVSPIMINSNIVSKQNRKRLYWTNINFAPLVPKELYFNKNLYILAHGFIKDEIRFFPKFPTLTAQSPASKYRIVVDDQKCLEAFSKGEIHKLRRGTDLTRPATPEECEEFQTLPDGYTSCISKTARYECIGNGWTVDVIAHILNGLK